MPHATFYCMDLKHLLGTFWYNNNKCVPFWQIIAICVAIYFNFDETWKNCLWLVIVIFKVIDVFVQGSVAYHVGIYSIMCY